MSLLTGQWPLVPSILGLLLGAAALLTFGRRFTHLVDHLADVTGLGKALAGAVLLGAVTSLPGLITTLVAALEEQASLAVSNSLGGIAAQTAFLAVADLTYRRANLEHAAASLPNLLQVTVLLALIGFVLVGVASSEIELGHVHPVSLVLPFAYVAGLRLSRDARDDPMWKPTQTVETVEAEPAGRDDAAPVDGMWLRFVALASIVAGSGFVVARSGVSLVERTDLSGSLVGGLLTAVVTSLPELVVVLVAVRAGSVTLAVANIVGGNSFDIMMVAVADVAFLRGPIYAAIDEGTMLVLAVTLLLTAILGTGLVRRQREGIGFEGVAILVIYVMGFATVHAIT